MASRRLRPFKFWIIAPFYATSSWRRSTAPVWPTPLRSVFHFSTITSSRLTALLAENVYFRRNSTKFLLGQFIGDRLPSPILGQPKRGFSIPRTNHLTLSEMCGLLSHGCLIRDGILQPKALLRMQENRQFDKLWAFYLFECWFSGWAGSE